MPETAVDAAVKFHISLNVADLDASVAFYRALLGVEPAKRRHDYAKFEPQEPPLVLSLEPGARTPGGTLNHVGLRFADTESLVAAQYRLEAAGLKTNREEGVECCYARQTKFWVFDPDRTLWEIYVLEGDIDHRGDGQSVDHFEATSVAPPVVPVVSASVGSKWEHRFGEAVPDRLPFDESSLESVQLQGTFNKPVDERARTKLLNEVFRVLQPGGKVHLRNLVADKPLPPGPPDLPGPAAVVEAVPMERELLESFEGAGFEDVAMVHFDAVPCFRKGDVSMRQLRLQARKPEASSTPVAVMYKGPFRRIEDDGGRTFQRGVRCVVTGDVAQRLQSGTLAEQFVVFDACAAGGCG